jgi:hypothetical protein
MQHVAALQSQVQAALQPRNSLFLQGHYSEGHYSEGHYSDHTRR